MPEVNSQHYIDIALNVAKKTFYYLRLWATEEQVK